MKVLAMYLPQFHRVKENDEWWGEGFTDWVSTKNAKPLYEGHYQPHVPQDNNYYDLSNIESMRWQSELMHRYSVDGVCMYHYWFEKGKRILEKPAEILLDHKDIDMPFCFSWANETWARSWGNVKEANVWSNLCEPDVQSKSILLKQEYGNEEDWRVHFNYLLPFFRDPRYIKYNGKPLFMIYKTRLINCLDDMLTCWRKWIKEEGFDDLYIIGSGCNPGDYSSINAELYHEPLRANKSLIENIFTAGIKKINYNSIWNNIIYETTKENTYYGGFVSYDDTPRRGVEGIVVEDVSPKKFGEYLSKLMAKNYKQGNEFVFINAWNEWGEGMHLEPDEKNGYAFLEQIPLAKQNYKDIELFNEVNNERYNAVKRQSDKYEMYLNDLDRWMTLRETNISIASLLKKYNAKKIAIYGYGIMGKHLKNELEQAGMTVEAIIDIQKNKIHVDVPVFSPNEEIPNVDLIIVSSYYFMNDIKINSNSKVVSLGAIINEGYSEL